MSAYQLLPLADMLLLQVLDLLLGGLQLGEEFLQLLGLDLHLLLQGGVCVLEVDGRLIVRLQALLQLSLGSLEESTHGVSRYIDNSYSTRVPLCPRPYLANVINRFITINDQSFLQMYLNQSLY